EEVVGTTIDFNRAGVPLMELVTEPVITSAKQAGDFARELQLLLRYLGASNANMEKGEMRVEANVSVAPKATPSSAKESPLGTKVEIKNLNSFRAMERAVEYEIARQSDMLERGEKVVQETRGWDESKQSTFPQRVKEGSADYRYFPDPDLPSLKLSEIPEYQGDALMAGMPELPWQRRERYNTLGLKTDDADMFVRQPGYGRLFDSAIVPWGSGDARVALAANFVANNVAGLRDANARDSEFSAEMPMDPENLGSLINMLFERKVSSQGAKEILSRVLESGRAPEVIAAEQNLLKIDDQKSLEDIVTSVLSAHGAVVAELRGGKVAALQFLIGQAMKIARGAADPTVLRTLIEKKIAETIS
ncbi:MAG: Asp-tRNA(Asn)/Glu-tRNA(Gln) amidotransferase subunit GatB, partial [bacterium]|nr:Asp-tRNA(Asn)/Glu-tRNA(Gln) amidotransferase subunit GatB [bacterium]